MLDVRIVCSLVIRMYVYCMCAGQVSLAYNVLRFEVGPSVAESLHHC